MIKRLRVNKIEAGSAQYHGYPGPWLSKANSHGGGMPRDVDD